MNGFELRLTDLFGFAGAGLFLLSWLLQAFESRLHKRSVVSIRFWLLRLAGLSSLIVHYFIRRDIVSLLFMFGTALLTVYNIFLIKKFEITN